MEENTAIETNNELGGEVSDSGTGFSDVPAPEVSEPMTPESAEAGTAPQEAYTPNLTYKVYDEEREIDDWAKPLINSKETEEQFRSLFSKAGAVEQMTAKRERQLEEFNELSSNHERIMGIVSQAKQDLNNGDMDSVFQTLGIPEQQVYKWVLDKINYQNLPPEQRQVLDEKSQYQKRTTELERSNQMLEQNWQNEQVQARTRELDWEMNNSEVEDAARAFDTRMGRKGAFRDEVIRHGVADYQITGSDMPVRQAIQEVMQKFATTVQTGQTPNGTATASQKPPVIPTIGTSNVSPTRKQWKSIDEMRKYASTME
jgi:hypothetical protein